MKKDFSTEVLEKGSKIIEEYNHKRLGKIVRRDIVEKLEMLSGMTTVMLEHLQHDKNDDPSLERAIKKIVSGSLERGLKIGRHYSGTPEELMKTIELIPIHPNKIIESLPKKKRKLAKYVLHSLLLGKYSYETGLAITATLSKSEREKYIKTLEEETIQYIW